MDHFEGVEGGETRRQLLTRVSRAMAEITTSDCRTQVIVAHGFALTFVIAAWFRLPAESAAWIGFRSNSGGITRLQQDERFGDRALVSFNDRAHFIGIQ